MKASQTNGQNYIGTVQEEKRSEEMHLRFVEGSSNLYDLYEEVRFVGGTG